MEIQRCASRSSSAAIVLQLPGAIDEGTFAYKFVIRSHVRIGDLA